MTGTVSGEGSWGVVAIVDEPLSLVAAFVAHYLWLGAAEVHLLLDDPRPEVVAALQGRPRVRVTAMDAAWWAARGEARPEPHARRQGILLTEVYRDYPRDWMLHVDADEFLIPARPIGEQLAAVPEGKVNLTAPAFESVRRRGAAGGDVFGTLFRRAVEFSPEDLSAVWGEEAALFGEEGFLGHSVGKSFVRTGHDLWIGAHYGVAPDLGPDVNLRLDWARDHSVAFDGAVLHFDALTPLHWQLKFLRRKPGAVGRPVAKPGRAGWRARQYQSAAVLERAQDAGALAALTERVLTLDSAQEATLRARGALVEMEHAIAARAREAFPDLTLDFSVAAFDRDLRAYHAALFAAWGL
jgi:hypothetical protein